MNIKTVQINKKRQKPKDYDLHLKYACPNCGLDHWLSLLETSTPNFKVVCECGVVFKVKRIVNIKILYSNSNRLCKKEIVPELKQKSNSLIVEQAVGVLTNYGFTDKEAKDLVMNCYDASKSYSVSDLVKKALESIKVKNDSLNETV